MTHDEELVHLLAPSKDPKQFMIDYWGHRAEKAEDEVARLRAQLAQRPCPRNALETISKWWESSKARAMRNNY